MAAFILVLFLSAFLLFQVQPVIARQILPWYGGSSSVWITCMLFFQIGLVVGYGYAHLLVSILKKHRKLQVVIHFVLIAIAIIGLPIIPASEMKPMAAGTSPVMDILKLLGKTVGLPYIILSATAPLLQSWFSKLYPGRSPFRLYAVSNAGSLLALVSYPFLFEVYYPVSLQAAIWSSGFVVFALLLSITACLFTKNARRNSQEQPTAQYIPQTPRKPPWSHRLRWIGFSTCGSILLISITNQLCEDVAVIPFLWVIPLALYLSTFIIAFDHSRWYSRKLMIGATIVSVCLMIIQMNGHYSHTGNWPIPLQIVILCQTLFCTCLVCHGEIVRLKPPSKFLTEFYLLISIGGALGGIFVNLVAPFVFDGYRELHLGLLLFAFLVTLQLLPILTGFFGLNKSPAHRMIGIAASAAWIIAVTGLVLGLKKNITLSQAQVIASSRGFFGVLKVSEKQIPGSEKFRSLYHGKTIHGLQFASAERKVIPTAYFHPESGVGTALNILTRDESAQKESLNVGVLGLGIGTLAAYARPHDRFRFYEISPEVIALANSHFTFLKDCRGEVAVVSGDGRISLEGERQSGSSGRFDLLVIDAFSGHAPPIHLLTREAFELYFDQISEDGILALNVSNAEIDFSDPIRNQAILADKRAFQVIHEPRGGFPSIWILVTTNDSFQRALEQSGRITPWSRSEPKKIFWTDDFNSLLQALR